MRTFVFVVVLFLVACSGPRQDAAPAFRGTDITGAKLGGDLVLPDSHGQVRRLSDFHGKVVALFFGYTHCPDVCPTTLANLARAVRDLGERGKQVQVLFVTLDPARDTPEVLNRYVPSFNPGFIGLRGDEKTTNDVAHQFKIFHTKQETGSRSGYTIDHSAGIYVYDKKGILRLYLNHGQSVEDIAHDFGMLLNE
ncbi:MAG: SCO family protein [Methylophilaceae bacterium]|nr:SCO family protein [Methylophilaceae bacterium]